jgi:hypothetical protein
MITPSRIATVLLTALSLSCSAEPADSLFLNEIPVTENFCLDAQRIVTRTTIPMDVVIHDDFTSFVKSKAVIEGPTIQQYNWYDETDELLGISCKLKSADHLNLTFGEASAGPDGACQSMNQGVFELVAKEVTDPVFEKVVFDPNETVSNDENPGMTGPDWLAPYTMVYSVAGELHIASKGFIVGFTDERYAQAPDRFRGVHYCHLIAPAHLKALLTGEAEPGTRIGQTVPADFPNSGPGPELSGAADAGEAN